MNSKIEKVPKSTVSLLDAQKHNLKLMLVKFEKASICIYNILIFLLRSKQIHVEAGQLWKK